MRLHACMCRNKTKQCCCWCAGPFSHRTMLTLEEKGVAYNKLLLDESSIPEWRATLTALHSCFKSLLRCIALLLEVFALPACEASS